MVEATSTASPALLRVSEAAQLLRLRPGDMCRYVQHAEDRHHITAHTLLRLLNGHRSGPWSREMWRLPASLLTLDEVARIALPRMEHAKARKRLLAMCNRTKNPPPHIRFTRRIIRFDLSEFNSWLSGRSAKETILK